MCYNKAVAVSYLDLRSLLVTGCLILLMTSCRKLERIDMLWKRIAKETLQRTAKAAIRLELEVHSWWETFLRTSRCFSRRAWRPGHETRLKLMGSFAIPIPILCAADVRCRVCQFFIKCIEKKQKKLVNLPNSRHCSSKHYLFGWGRELAGRILTIVVAAVLIQRMRLAACHVEASLNTQCSYPMVGTQAHQVAPSRSP